MKIAVVTGASSGMGREFVLQFEKYITVDEIWVIARRSEALAELSGTIRAHIRAIPLDLNDQESFDIYADMLKKASPDVSLLVNCAGFGKFGKFENIPLSESAKMIDLNCKALVMMTELTIPYMKSGAKILQLDSLSAFQPVPYITVYGATKAFVLSYSRAMNQELKGRGIRCMAVNPGWVKTEFFDRAFQSNDSEVQYFNRLYEANKIVAVALHDLYKSKKDVCIPGFPVRMQVHMVKLLPHGLVMKIWLNQQKKAKNNKNLTAKK